jgi:hypothetical protein
MRCCEEKLYFGKIYFEGNAQLAKPYNRTHDPS